MYEISHKSAHTGRSECTDCVKNYTTSEKRTANRTSLYEKSYKFIILHMIHLWFDKRTTGGLLKNLDAVKHKHVHREPEKRHPPIRRNDKEERRMQHIYVVRHCEAEGQAPDAQLTAAGAEQAEKLAEVLMDKNIDYIISSPYERARRTIKPLSDKIAVAIVLDERLTERVLSEKNHPEWRDMLRKTYDDLDLCYAGGESGHAAMSRAVSVVTEALSSGKKNIVLVSHGNLISLLLKHFDDRMGFKEWASFTSPDVFHLAFSADQKPRIHRIWAE